MISSSRYYVSLQLYIQIIMFCLTLYTVLSRVTGMNVSKDLSMGKPALRVTWTIPQSNITISQYQLQYRRKGTRTPWRGAGPVSSGSATSTLLEKLDASTTYQVRIRALSAIGNGAWSRVESETTYIGTLSF